MTHSPAAAAVCRRHHNWGLAILGAIGTLVLVGPLLTGDPTEVVDATGASLVAPLGQRWIFRMADGTTIAAEHAVSDRGGWWIDRRFERVWLPGDRVESSHQRRFWLGTDVLGRDVVARLLAGGRVSLLVGSMALTVALLIGVILGLAAGWTGGVVDAVLMRLVDGLLSIPLLFVLLLLGAVLRPSLTVLVVVLGSASWMGVARLTRGQVLSLKEREFVLAARTMGASPLRIARVHLLPNAATPITQDAALRLGDLILVETSLSFLGFGVQPPTPSWGAMVAEGQGVLGTGWWLTLFPGLAIAATVVAAALAADSLTRPRTPSR